MFGVKNFNLSCLYPNENSLMILSKIYECKLNTWMKYLTFDRYCVPIVKLTQSTTHTSLPILY